MELCLCDNKPHGLCGVDSLLLSINCYSDIFLSYYLHLHVKRCVHILWRGTVNHLSFSVLHLNGGHYCDLYNSQNHRYFSVLLKLFNAELSDTLPHFCVITGPIIKCFTREVCVFDKQSLHQTLNAVEWHTSLILFLY